MAEIIEGPFARFGETDVEFTWKTDTAGAGTSEVRLGPDAMTLNQQFTVASSPVTEHRVMVPLASIPSPAVYVVSSLDVNTGSPIVQSAVFKVSNSVPAFTQSPQPAVSGTAATVAWESSCNGLSRVEYGTDALDMNLVAWDNENSHSHLTVLPSLKSGTTYYYRAVTVDSSGHSLAGSPSGSFVFSNAPVPMGLPSVVSAVPDKRRLKAGENTILRFTLKCKSPWFPPAIPAGTLKLSVVGGTGGTGDLMPGNVQHVNTNFPSAMWPRSYFNWDVTFNATGAGLVRLQLEVKSTSQANLLYTRDLWVLVRPN